MSWFQLDPNGIAERTKAGRQAAEVPSLGTSLRRGMVGFTAVSVAGFAPWALGGRWFQRTVGEAGMYAACAIVFIGLSGLLLHRLILGPGSLGRFYKLFGMTFAVYSAAWIAGWMTLRGHPGSIAGLFAGTALMGWMLARAFDASNVTVKVIAALFVLNSAGYFVGGWVEGGLMGMKGMSIAGIEITRKTQVRAAMLSWGVFYGVGFGAGLGCAFHLCQSRARELLAGHGPGPR